MNYPVRFSACCLLVALLIANMTALIFADGVRDYLASLKTERQSLACSKAKLDNAINLLNLTISSNGNNTSLRSVLDMRTKQSAKIATAVAMLDSEIGVIDSKCMIYNGSDCNTCKDGYTNYPNCVPVCFGLAANNASVCTGHGSCIAPNNCSCSSPYIGSTCSAFFTPPMTPYLAHAYYFNNTFSDSAGSLHLIINPFDGGAGVPSFSNDAPFPGGKSVYFDGSKNGIASTVNANLTVSNTLSLWLKDPYGGVALGFNTDGNYIRFDLASGKGFTFKDDRFLDAFTTDGTLFATSVWRHLAFVFKTDGTDLYVDGSLYKTSTSIASKNLNTRPLTIGGHSVGTYFYKGYVANVMIFKKALTAAEVSSLKVNNYF